MSPQSNKRSLTPEQLLENLRSGNFSGEKIDFIFSHTDIYEMIAYLEKVSGLDFDVVPNIPNKATYHLKDIPWDNALALLLEDNDLKIGYKYNTFKIFRGQSYEVVFTEVRRAKIVMFLYKHFFKLILALLFLISLFLGSLIYRKQKRAGKSQLKNLLDPDSANEIKKRLIFLLDIEKIFRNEDLTLVSFAEKLNITPHQLSWVINREMNQSFSTLINRYRIEDVKKRLENGIDNHTTILQMALDSGFSTKTAFNRAFKKFTGLTPTQYRKKK